MLETYLLEELVVFSQVGTLAETAEKLHLTQPTITRGLQKLEAAFGVPLFDRQPNRLTLTAAGHLAAEQAAKILAANQTMVDTVRNFDHQTRIIQVGATLPGPLMLAKYLQNDSPVAFARTTSLIEPADVLAHLRNRQESVIMTDDALTSPDVQSVYVGTESLFVHLNQFMYPANQSTITFKELAGLSFIVLQDIGPWRQLIQNKIPNAHFMYQREQEAVKELTTYSDFPNFTTNITTVTRRQNDRGDQVTIPISDDSAKVAVYATYLTENAQKLAPFVALIQQHWPK